MQEVSSFIPSQCEEPFTWGNAAAVHLNTTFGSAEKMALLSKKWKSSRRE